jgi:hypothetical protein
MCVLQASNLRLKCVVCYQVVAVRGVCKGICVHITYGALIIAEVQGIQLAKGSYAQYIMIGAMWHGIGAQAGHDGLAGGRVLVRNLIPIMVR